MVVKEINRINILNENKSVNKQNYQNFYKDLDPLEGISNNENSDTESSEENSEEENTTTINNRENSNKKETKEKKEQEDTWFLSHTKKTSSDEEYTSSEETKTQKTHKHYTKRNHKRIRKTLTPEQKKDWMNKHTREKSLPENGDRRKNWAKTPTKKIKPHTNTINGSEDDSALSELTLRLELNGINLHEATRQIGTLWDPVDA